MASVTSAGIFSVTGITMNTSSLSGGALSRGIDAYTKKDYEQARTEFRRAIGLDPYSSNSLKAYDFLAQTYLRMERPADAERTYREAIRLAPQHDEFHLKLANLYFSLDRVEEAGKEYLEAVRINPSQENIYSLGQNYLAAGRLEEAETQLKRILSINSGHYGAVYSLGQIDRERGNYDSAIARFRQAVDLKKDFAFAYSDLGFAYADVGQSDKALEQAQILDTLNTTLAADLRDYVYKVRKPGMFFASTLGTIALTAGPGTKVSTLDPSLATPDASKDFTLTVFFDKIMDRASVENIANWKISRAYGLPTGGSYNWGMAVPDTEVSLSSLPRNVYYDESAFSAKITFTVPQNAAGDGTVDLSHILFGFYGKDAYGNTMDSTKNEYLGMSIIV